MEPRQLVRYVTSVALDSQEIRELETLGLQPRYYGERLSNRNGSR